MKFEVMQDRKLATKIITHPKIWPHVSDDFSGQPENFIALTSLPILYLAVKENEDLLGLFVITWENSICWKIHTCLLPETWGQKAKQIGNELRAWLFSSTNCHRIVTDVPANNRLALAFAKSCGMTEYGLNPQSFLKDGQLYDQVLLGVSKCQ